MKIKKTIANVFIGIGIVCILGALGLAIANEYENLSSYRKSQDIIAYIDANAGVTTEDSDEESDSAEAVDNEYDYNNDYYDMPTVNIDGYDYIGYIGFDSLDIQMPVMSDWDYSRLKISPCRYSGSMEEHNLVVAGHNYRNGFRMLKQLEEGDYLYFMTMNGVIHRYQVGAIEVIESTGIDEMINSRWDLSLYTCTYEGTMRYTVRCNEVLAQ